MLHFIVPISKRFKLITTIMEVSTSFPLPIVVQLLVSHSKYYSCGLSAKAKGVVAEVQNKFQFVLDIRVSLTSPFPKIFAKHFFYKFTPSPSM